MFLLLWVDCCNTSGFATTIAFSVGLRGSKEIGGLNADVLRDSIGLDAVGLGMMCVGEWDGDNEPVEHVIGFLDLDCILQFCP